MAGLIGSNYLRADKVPDHVINYSPEPGEYSGMGSDAMLDLQARALIQHARSLGNKDVDSVKRYIDSLDTLEDPRAMEVQKKASSYFDRRRMSYEDVVTLDTLLSGGDFLDALATSLGATRDETVEYLDEINSRRTGDPGQMAKVRDTGYVADLALSKNAAGIYSDWKNPVRRYGLRRQDSAQKEFHSRSRSVTPDTLGFLMDPGAAAEELLWHPANPATPTPDEARLQAFKDRASADPGGYEAFSPDEFARALSSVKHSLIRGLRKQDPSLTLIQAERLSNGLMIPMLEERSEFIRGPFGVPGRKDKLRSIKERFPLDRENSDQLAAVLRVYDGEKNGTFERIQKKDKELADLWREAVKAVKQRFENGVYPEQIASVNRRAAARAASKGGNASGESRASGVRKGVRLDTYRFTATNDLDRVVIDPKNIKGTGIAYDAVKDRVQIKPEDRKEFEGWLDYIAGLDPTMKKQRLVPPDWRTNPYWTSADGYQRDYDFGAAFYEGKKYDDPLTSMVKMESDGLYHLDDRGKAPNHPTFSKQSHYYLDETLRKKYGALAGDWEKSDDGEWLYVPGEAESKVPPGTIRTLREMRQAAKAGDAGKSPSSGVPSGHNPALDGYSGPKIMINPTTFRNNKDALCVAWNEALRVFMEANDYEPQSEPTEAQRRFFADTPYADDELQLRRTIIARICVFDTSVKDPTDDQLSESAQLLRSVVDSGFAKTDDEIEKCERLARAIEAAVGAEPVEPKEEPLRQAPLQGPETQAAIGAGETEDDPMRQLAKEFQDDVSRDVQSALDDEQAARSVEMQPGDVDTSRITVGPQEPKVHTMDDVGKAVAERHRPDVVIPGDDTPAPRQEQPAVQPNPAAAPQPQQERLAPGLTRGGARGNILEFEGRRISEREFDRIQAKFQEGGGQPDAAGPVVRGPELGPKGPQGPALNAPMWIGQNEEGPAGRGLFQDTQVDSGRKDALGRRLDDRGRVIA